MTGKTQMTITKKFDHGIYKQQLPIEKMYKETFGSDIVTPLTVAMISWYIHMINSTTKKCSKVECDHSSSFNMCDQWVLQKQFHGVAGQ